MLLILPVIRTTMTAFFFPFSILVFSFLLILSLNRRSISLWRTFNHAFLDISRHSFSKNKKKIHCHWKYWSNCHVVRFPRPFPRLSYVPFHKSARLYFHKLNKNISKRKTRPWFFFSSSFFFLNAALLSNTRFCRTSMKVNSIWRQRGQ